MSRFDFQPKSIRLTPKGWPMEVEVRELSTGALFGFYKDRETNPAGASTFHMGILVLCVFDPETGEPLFKDPEEVNNLPARMLPGLLEIVRVASELNFVREGEGPDPT